MCVAALFSGAGVLVFGVRIETHPIEEADGTTAYMKVYVPHDGPPENILRSGVLLQCNENGHRVIESRTMSSDSDTVIVDEYWTLDYIETQVLIKSLKMRVFRFQLFVHLSLDIIIFLNTF